MGLRPGRRSAGSACTPGRRRARPGRRRPRTGRRGATSATLGGGAGLPEDGGCRHSSGMATLVPLGDQAVLADCGDEAGALRFAAAVRAAAPGWLLDVVPAYKSVGVFFDARRARW